MAVTGRGRTLGFDGCADDLLPRPEMPYSPAPRAANDWLWGNAPPPVVDIPYTWLTPPARFRSDPPYNVATITRTNGESGRSRDAASAGEFGENELAVTLDSTLPDDPANLATYVTTWLATQPSQVPRQRCPSLSLNLNAIYDLVGPVGVWRVLDREIGDRISISGTPSGAATAWPQGTTSLVIEGIQHQIAAEVRRVVWSTVPIIGSTPGTPGPWFRLDASTTDIGSDKLPF